MKLNWHSLELAKSEYINNKKPYLWLIDKEDWEYYCNITVNLPWLDHLKDYNFIDWDFINCCFSYIGDCEKWLKDNLKIKEFHKYWEYYYFTL